jgi:hypothetical protein
MRTRSEPRPTRLPGGALPGTTSRRLWPAAALALVALVGAGCSNDPAANAGTGTAGTASTAGDQGAGNRDMGIKFAECVRKNGVGDFPDPDATGDFNYGVSVTPEVWTKAVQACKDLQPPGSLSSDRTPEQQEAALAFAKCMRENGVPDFPDPVDGQPLVDTNRIPSSNRSGGMTILNAAMTECGDLTRAAVGK